MSYRNLIGLPNEILYLIAVALELEDPRDLAALSQTCRRINSACHGLVEARRDMDKQYRIFHDRNPLAVPKLLKLASDDALKEAWHVRRVEFWDYRNDLDSMRWRETFTSTIYPSRDGRLRSRSADNLVREGTSRSVDDSPETEKWLSNVALQRSVEEVEATNAEGRHLLRRDLPMYRKMLEDVFGIEDESILEQDIHYDEQGAEELSKALLLSLCPNLDTLVFLG